MENRALNQVNKPHAGRIACEIVLGTIGAFLSYIFCIFLLRNARGAPSVAAAAYSIIAITASLCSISHREAWQASRFILIHTIGQRLGHGNLHGYHIYSECLGSLPILRQPS